MRRYVFSLCSIFALAAAAGLVCDGARDSSRPSFVTDGGLCGYGFTGWVCDGVRFALSAPVFFSGPSGPPAWNEVARVGWYKFDENADSTVVTDSSGHGFNGVLRPMNTSAVSVPGVVGNGFRLTPTNGVMVFGDGLYPIDAPLTYAAWIKMYSLPVNGVNLVGGLYQANGLNYGDGFALAIVRDSSGPLEMTDYGIDWSVRSSSPVPLGSWHFVVGTAGVDGLATLYVDGVELMKSARTDGSVGTWVPRFDSASGHTGLMIGTLSATGWGGWSIPYDGVIDEVQIWHGCLTRAQVESLYASYAVSAFDEVPAIRYQCEDNADSSVVVNSGTASNGDGTLCSWPDTLNTSAAARSGYDGNGFLLDGTQFILGGAAAISVLNGPAFTYSMMISPQHGAKHWTAYNINGVGGYIHLGYYNDDNGAYAVYDLNGDQPWASKSMPRVNGAWYNVTLVRDGTTLKHYWNGVLWLTETLSEAGVVNLPQFGGSVDSSGPRLVDDIRLYSRAFTADEVADLFGSYDPERNAATKGLMAWWKLDDNAGNNRVWDSTTNRVNGTWANGATAASSTADARQNAALTFNGATDSANMGRKLRLALGSPFSISLWVKVPTSAYQILLGTSETDHSDHGWSFFIAGGNIYFQMNASDTPADNEVQVYMPNASGDNAWHNLAVTSDGTGTRAGLSMFFDNGPDAVAGANMDCLTSDFGGDKDVVIGMTPSGAYHFGGIMDDVRVYDHALSAAERRQLWDRYSLSGSAPSGPAVVYVPSGDPGSYWASGYDSGWNTVNVYWSDTAGAFVCDTPESLYLVYIYEGHYAGGSWGDMSVFTSISSYYYWGGFWDGM